jgi:hypothetical protein
LFKVGSLLYVHKNDLKSEVAVEEVSRNVTISTAMMRPSVPKTAKKQKMKNLLKGARPKEDSSNAA